MKTRPRLRLLAGLRGWPAAPRPRRRQARHAARASVLLGGLTFALFSLALSAAVETVKPEWRDPEYGHRLSRVYQWQGESRDRPLVVVLGSSRAQMGVSPVAMGFPDEPGQPLVLNFGYRGGGSLGSWLQGQRLLDDGVQPRAILFVLATIESKTNTLTVDQLPGWKSRYTAADLRHLSGFIDDLDRGWHQLAVARVNPWIVRREVLAAHALPDWQPPIVRYQQEGWRRMDRYGYTPFPEELLTDSLRQVEVARHLGDATEINTRPVSGLVSCALGEMAKRCRAEGIALAVAWAPESPAYRGVYTPAGWAYNDAYSRELRAQGVRVFPAPEHLEDSDFADGVHLLPAGAAKYSQWLADTQLRPWLAAIK